MENGNLITVEAVGLSEGERMITRMAAAMEAMAAMVKSTNERMAELEQTVRRLEKVTPAQAASLNGLIRGRAKAVCNLYRAEGREKEAAAAIRKDVRLYTGARTAREISRCDYGPTRELIELWDDLETMRRIRKGARG